jgi:hypothetical protein
VWDTELAMLNKEQFLNIIGKVQEIQIQKASYIILTYRNLKLFVKYQSSKATIGILKLNCYLIWTLSQSGMENSFT